LALLLTLGALVKGLQEPVPFDAPPPSAQLAEVRDMLAVQGEPACSSSEVGVCPVKPFVALPSSLPFVHDRAANR
jgi:hypothetical protein